MWVIFWGEVNMRSWGLFYFIVRVSELFDGELEFVKNR